MTTTKKLAIAVVALSLALVCAIGSTLAFLVAESNKVTNTFTYGNIKIELWENTVNDDGELTDTKDDDGIEYVNVVPGDTVNKNPTVTVVDKSEDCYVYVLVTNNLVLDGYTADNPVATLNIDTTSKWTQVATSGNSVLYRYTAGAQEANAECEVFTTVKFNSALTVDDVAILKDIKNPIVIQAYAHQSDNTNVDTADAAAKTWMNKVLGLTA